MHDPDGERGGEPQDPVDPQDRRHRPHGRQRSAPGRAPRLHGTIARNIGIAIMAGTHKPGDILGGEIEESARLGVSRTAYREAIRILAAKGLVESRPRAGTRITPRARWNLLDPDVLAWMFEGEPDTSFVIDLFELRGLIEPAAAALAATRRTTADLEAMRSALDAMAAHGLADDRGRIADRKFHRAILAAVGNEPLMVLASGVGAAVHWTTHFKHRRHHPSRDPLPDHWKVYDAIAAGDAERARRAMAELLRLALFDMGLGNRGLLPDMPEDSSRPAR